MQDLPSQVPAPLPSTPTSSDGLMQPAARSAASAGASAQPSDPLTQATDAVDRAIAQTMQNPHERLQAIALIKETYLKARFGA